MIDKDLVALCDEELVELLVSLEAIDSTLTSKEGGNNDEIK